jgi:hypothetical protein
LAEFNNDDGRIWLALTQLQPNPGERTNREWWRLYWRQQAFLADQFVARVGYGAQQVQWLKYLQPLDVPVPYDAQEKPYFDERIDRLEALLG